MENKCHGLYCPSAIRCWRWLCPEEKENQTWIQPKNTGNKCADFMPVADAEYKKEII